MKLSPPVAVSVMFGGTGGGFKQFITADIDDVSGAHLVAEVSE